MVGTLIAGDAHEQWYGTHCYSNIVVTKVVLFWPVMLTMTADEPHLKRFCRLMDS